MRGLYEAVCCVAFAGCYDATGMRANGGEDAPSTSDSSPAADAWIPDPGPPTLFVGAGDIAKCTALGYAGVVRDPHELTADLVNAYPSNTPVFTLGDNVYSDGTALEFATCYAKGWGQFRDRTYPVAGNHDYNTDNATPYYDYFGPRAGDPAKGYYTYDVGAWRVIVLNSNVPMDDASPQLAWLRAELQTNTKPCTMAMWHHPRFASDRCGTNDGVRPLYEALYEYDADLVLVGHAHNYERFAPIDHDGNLDPVRGIRQIIVGTAGADPRGMEHPAVHSEVFVDDVFGILELSLYADRYEWKLVTTTGSVADSGTQTCH